MKNTGKLAPWLKRRIPAGGTFEHTRHVLGTLGIETVCTNAGCPNIGHCWQRGTATVLILGNICTRNCKFCSIASGKPKPPDATEPRRVAMMAKEMSLKYLVITSVDRDDLADGGAEHFKDVVNTARQANPNMKFELLLPDFRNCQDKAIQILSTALPFVFGHNIETVPSLYNHVKPQGDYKLSLKLLKKAKQQIGGIKTKSSIMLGLGETQDEITAVLSDLRKVDCDRIAIGQYLRPNKTCADVVEYIEPEKFDLWDKKAKELGFQWVSSSPFTRSSYHAEEETT